MEWILSIPMPLRLLLVAVAGGIIGGQLNRGIYELAWDARRISPWSPPPAGVPPRRWTDRLPVLGWWFLRREAAVQGAGFWVRPLLIELGTAIGLAGLYWLEVGQRALWPADLAGLPPTPGVLHAQFLSHVLLICLMIVATFIDFDEQTIPDEITVTGAVAGLLLLAVWPGASLPTACLQRTGVATAEHLVVTSSTFSAAWLDGLGGPHSWPPVLNAPTGCVLAVAGVWAWCLAIMHKTCTLRRGWLRGACYLVVSIVRRRTWVRPCLLGVGLASLLVLVWSSGGDCWQSLFSAVTGMVFGGGLIWAVRIIAGQALQVEAMGFGDVTLMAMIGAFLGWQAALLVFFLAPFSALVIALAQWLLAGERRIAFGPYLCLAAVVVSVAWRPIWFDWALPMFGLGWFLPAVVGCSLLVMGGLLWLWRLARDAWFER